MTSTAIAAADPRDHYLFLDVNTVKAQIAVLLHSFPEMADDIQLLADSIEGSTDFNEVVTRLVRLERDAEAFAGAIKAQEEALSERRARYISKQQNIRAMIQSLMESAGQHKVLLPEATLSIASGRVSCVVTDLDALPTEFVRTERFPCKSEITAALSAGERVNGAELRNPQPYLRIST